MALLIRMALAAAASLASAPAFASANAAAVLERMAGADSNRDGNITRAELTRYRAASFSRLDRNSDGVLTRDDIPAIAARLNPDLDFDRLMAQFDGNDDRRVSRDEFVNGPTAYFDRADTNNDNILSQAERSAAMAAARRH
jgi:Ca2+-binding EF-hand superfamily protein